MARDVEERSGEALISRIVQRFAETQVSAGGTAGPVVDEASVTATAMELPAQAAAREPDAPLSSGVLDIRPVR
jgi:hypothetical protein